MSEQWAIEGLTEKEINDFMAAITEPEAILPLNLIGRIDVIQGRTPDDIKVVCNLRDGMPGSKFAAMLRTIADGFETGEVHRVDQP